MHGAHSTSYLRTTISGAEVPPRCLAWHGGRAEISSPHIDRMPLAWRVCGGAGTTLTPSAAHSHWPVFGMGRVVSPRGCGPTSRHLRLWRERGPLPPPAARLRGAP